MLMRIYMGWNTVMKNTIKTILALVMALVLMICMTACGNKEDAEAADSAADNQTEASQDAEGEDAAASEQGEAVRTLTPDAEEEIGQNLPMQIDSITLYEDGSVAVVPVDDLKKNEIKDDADAVYPFEESGDVKDIYVVTYGNGGYRTIIALMKDGSISAVNGRALIEDHIFAVMDDVANRDNFVSVENVTEEDGSSIIATTEDGEEVILDYSLNFDEPEAQ